MKKLIAALIFVSVFIFPNSSTYAYYPVISSKYPADLSFLVIDLKFNYDKGVQICEIQQGILSGFEGYDFLHGEKGLVARTFTDTLSSYGKPVWFYEKDIVDINMHKRFNQIYKPFKNISELQSDGTFVSAASGSVSDPHQIEAYHGIYVGYIDNITDSLARFRERYPGLIPMDHPFAEFYRDKLNMNRLFSEDDDLKRFKPACSYFKKGYTPTLAQEIIQNIGTNIVVIKPITTFKGKGVIIVKAEDLDSTLKYIFSDSKKLRQDSDLSYSWWFKDKSENFLVEEFVPSDTVYVPHLKNKPYDGTMRVVALVAYDQLETSIQFIETHWKLPPKSLNEKGSLNQKHKSFADIPHYAFVSPEINTVVEQQLSEALLKLYKKLLTKN
jgi:hypothetical protein